MASYSSTKYADVHSRGENPVLNAIDAIYDGQPAGSHKFRGIDRIDEGNRVRLLPVEG